MVKTIQTLAWAFTAAFLSMPLVATPASAQGGLMLEMRVSKDECERICSEGAQGYSDDTCRMAYYFLSGENAGVCRTTLDDVPNLKMRGKYRIYSGYFQRWLTNDLIANKWPNVSGPVGTRPKPNAPGTGITVNISKVALAGARVCAGARLKSGRHWILRNPNRTPGADYYEHAGYLCYAQGNYFYRKGTPMLAFTCSGNWSNCQRKPGDDGTYKPSNKRIEWQGTWYNVGLLTWTNSNSVAYEAKVQE